MGTVEPKIKVYTGVGQLLETLPVCPWLTQWDSARVVQFGFTWRDELAAVTDDGQVRLYALLDAGHKGPEWTEATQSTQYTVLSLGESASEIGVASAVVLPTCVYALLRNGTIAQCFFPGIDASYTAESPWTDRKAPLSPQQHPAVPVDPQSISAWSVCAATHTVYVATPETLYALHGDTYTLMSIDAPLDAVCASPNGKLLALVADQKLRVVKADLSRTLRVWDMTTSEAYAASRGAPPVLAPLAEPSFNAPVRDKGGIGGTGATRLAWCGDDTVAVAWNGSVQVVGPLDDPLTLPVPGAVHLFGHHDGLQLVHAEAHEYLDRVDPATEAALRPGSTHVATILLEASQLAQKNSPRAYEAVEALRKDLAHAVHVCVSAASQAWDVATQQELLKAALFGKTFLDAYDSTAYLRTARTLRVLNAVRDYHVGIPARYDAVQRQGASMLLYRLCVRRMHHLAERICDYLRVRPDEVLKHWARAKVAHMRGDTAQLAELIIAKFEAAGALNFAEIALTAWHAGHVRLATMLLDHEARAVGQVPLLLHMHEDRLALQRAVECGDADLVYYVLFRLQQRMSRGEFFRVVQAPLEAPDVPLPSKTVGVRPRCDATYAALAARLLERYAVQQDHELLRDFYFLDDRSASQALLRIAEAPTDAAHYDERVAALRAAAKHFAEDRQHTQDARLSEEAASLLGFQAGLDKELATMGVRAAGDSLVGLPLMRTIEVCLQHGLHKRAERLKHEYKVSDRMYFAARTHAFIAAQDWPGLTKCVGKRPPGGFEPVVSMLLHAGHVSEACRFARLGVADKSSRHALQALVERCPMEEHKAQLCAAISPT